jgi:hypothetical protein
MLYTMDGRSDGNMTECASHDTQLLLSTSFLSSLNCMIKYMYKMIISYYAHNGSG